MRGRQSGAFFQRQLMQWLDFTEADTTLPHNNQTGEHMKPGLYLFGVPSGGSVCVLRVGWLRKVKDGDFDEYECLNQVAPRRNGDYTTALTDAALKGPPKNWNILDPFPTPCPTLRIHIFHPLPCDEKAWSKHCPKPKDWEE